MKFIKSCDTINKKEIKMKIKKEYGVYSYGTTQGSVTKDVVDAFGHLIREGENISLREMYDRIKENYSDSDPKTKDVLKRLESETSLNLVIKDNLSKKELYRFNVHHDSIMEAEEYVDRLAKSEVVKDKYKKYKILEVSVETREGGILKKGNYEPIAKKRKLSK